MAAQRHVPRRTAGLDINDTHVVVSQLAFSRGGEIRLEAAGWTARPDGDDDRHLAETVRQLFRRAGVSATHICTALQTPSLVVRPFRHAKLSAGELAAALALEAEEALQQPRGNIFMDWHISQQASQPADGVAAGVLVAAPRAEVERHLAILAQADVFPTVVDAACLAVCNLYLALKERHSQAQSLCVVALSSRRADIAVLWEESTIFPRAVHAPAGSWEQAAPYLADSIADTLKYHQFKLRGPPVERLVLTGAVPHRDLLVARLREVVPLVHYWNPVADMKAVRSGLRPLMDNKSGAFLATSLGLALRRI
jgi:Tfp pilus assembly PilM family ATPase